MFAFKYLTLLTLLTGFVASAPIATDLSDEAQLIARAPAGGAPTGIIKRILAKVRPKKDKAVFWSGTREDSNGKPVSVKQVAEQHAAKSGGRTLNMELIKKKIRIPTPNTEAWATASKTWATRASGHVHAILGGIVRPNSVWNRIEKPALMKNDKVTKVTEHNKQTGTSTVTKRK